MERSIKIMTFAIALICHGVHFQAEDKARVEFEMRLAETRADGRLTEASVENASEKIYLHKEVLITNQDIIEARVVIGYDNATFDIEIEITEGAAKRLSNATAEHVGRPIALLFNGRVIVAPVLRDKISSIGVISGRFSREQAERIARGITSR
jgi:preprotein translocase subunit SecD